jgi:CRP/FNR family transcriptional regulator, cyclic AMP receptor protein
MVPQPPESNAYTWHPNSFLGQLRADTRTELLRTGTSRTYRDKEILLHKGDQSRHVLILVSGRVRVTADTDDGREALLAVRIEGELLGELAFLDDEPRSATVSAVTNPDELAEVRVIAQPRFRDFVATHADAGLAMSKTVAAKLRWATRRRVDFAESVTVRLARVLCELARQYGHADNAGVITLTPFTQSDWAGFISASLPSVQNSFTRLREARLVKTLYRQVEIADLSGLQEFARLTDEELG